MKIVCFGLLYPEYLPVELLYSAGHERSLRAAKASEAAPARPGTNPAGAPREAQGRHGWTEALPPWGRYPGAPRASLLLLPRHSPASARR